MAQKSSLEHQKNHLNILTTTTLIGGAIGLTLVGMFLLGADNPNPAWPTLWWIRPLIIVPLAGATGGAFSYFINHFRQHTGIVKILALLLSVIVFIVGIWLGFVLGFVGTYWN